MNLRWFKFEPVEGQDLAQILKIRSLLTYLLYFINLIEDMVKYYDTIDPRTTVLLFSSVNDVFFCIYQPPRFTDPFPLPKSIYPPLPPLISSLQYSFSFQFIYFFSFPPAFFNSPFSSFPFYFSSFSIPLTFFNSFFPLPASPLPSL